MSPRSTIALTANAQKLMLAVGMVGAASTASGSARWGNPFWDLDYGEVSFSWNVFDSSGQFTGWVEPGGYIGAIEDVVVIDDQMCGCPEVASYSPYCYKSADEGTAVWNIW